MLSDFEKIFEPGDNHTPTTLPSLRKNIRTAIEDTIFGRTYAVVGFDEVHHYRNLGKKFFSAMQLVAHATFAIGMTASPSTSRPADLWHLGMLMNMAGFRSANMQDYRAMITELRAGSRLDKKRMKDGRAQEVVMATAGGDVKKQASSVYHSTMIRWVSQMRMHYDGHIVRRDAESVDSTGKAISGLDPYHEWYIVFELPPKERALLDAIVQSFLRKGSSVGEVRHRLFAFISFQLTFHPSTRTFICTSDVTYFTPLATKTYNGSTQVHSRSGS